MEIIFSDHALDDLGYWKQTQNNKILQRIRVLIEDIEASPFRGIGKPEPLKHNYAGMWSRRINKTHRIIYEVSSRQIIIHALREHY